MNAFVKLLEVLFAGQTFGLILIGAVFVRVGYSGYSLYDSRKLELAKSAEIRTLVANDFGAVHKPYRVRLEHALDWIERKAGPPWSLRSLGLSLAIAVFYSLVGFMVMWWMGAPGKIDNTELISDQHFTEGWQRTALVCAWFFLAGVVMWVIFKARAIHRAGIRICTKLYILLRSPFRRGMSDYDYRNDDVGDAAQKMFSIFGCVLAAVIVIVPPHFLLQHRTTYFILIGIAAPFVATIIAGITLEGVVPILVAISVIGSAFAMDPLVIAGAVNLTFVMMSVAGFAAAFWVGMFGEGRQRVPEDDDNSTPILTPADATSDRPDQKIERGDRGLAIGITGAIGGAYVGFLAASNVGGDASFTNPGIISVLLFMIFLPIMNGLCDWASWAISRKLGRGLVGVMSDSVSGPMIKCIQGGALVFVDIVVALISLSVLVFLVVLGVELFNSAASHDGIFPPPLELSEYIKSVRHDPWSTSGGWVILMMVTTLLPTVLHFFVALVAFILTLQPSAKEMELLSSRLRSSDPAVYLPVCGRVAFFQSLMAPGGVLIFIVLVLGLYFALSPFWAMFGDFLQDIALTTVNAI